MHYKNGREAKIGDKVVGRNSNGLPVAGIVIDRNASEACNIAVIPLPPYACCSDAAANFLHVDDARFRRQSNSPL
jgi:hypothetical protein